jgi:hypothetical protein
VLSEVDSLMDGPDHGLEAGDGVFDGLGEEVGTLAAYRIGNLIAIPGGERSREVLQALRVLCFGEGGEQVWAGALQYRDDEGFGGYEAGFSGVVVFFPGLAQVVPDRGKLRFGRAGRPLLLLDGLGRLAELESVPCQN